MLRKFLAITIVSLLCASCASLKSVSLTEIPADRTKPINAEGWTWGLFGIYFTNAFVDDAVAGLKSQCPDGVVSGVYTKFDTKFYFFWTTRTVKAQAFCVSRART